MAVTVLAASIVTLQVPVQEPGRFWGVNETQAPASELTSIDQIPQRFRERIAQRLTAGGVPVNERNVLRYYRDGVAAGVFK